MSGKKKLTPIKPTTIAKTAPKVEAKAEAKVEPKTAPKVEAKADPEPGAGKMRNAALKAWETRRAKKAERERMTAKTVTVVAPKAKTAAVGLVARRRK
ncbi:MAG TPA: hypothetical protein VK524_22260 [Polyangiaceae bacterium]|nr:hypothetical protein [Polyangiaceae bacterium]